MTDRTGSPERFFVHGRLEQAPRRQEDRDLVRRYVASRVLPLHEPVAESVLTERLAALARDPVGLRRDLVEAGLVTRTRDGAEYWRTHVTEFDDVGPGADATPTAPDHPHDQPRPEPGAAQG